MMIWKKKLIIIFVFYDGDKQTVSHDHIPVLNGE